jgi:hypothetical protein
MNISQVASAAAAIEAARMAGIQQAGTAAATVSVQRETNRAAVEADVRKTEAVQEAEERPNTAATNGRKLDITV